VFQLCFNLKRRYDNAGKALGAANQHCVTAKLLNYRWGRILAFLPFSVGLRVDHLYSSMDQTSKTAMHHWDSTVKIRTCGLTEILLGLGAKSRNFTLAAILNLTAN
jgi:hypothetical protein